jgi:hypothetical protein
MMPPAEGGAARRLVAPESHRFLPWIEPSPPVLGVCAAGIALALIAGVLSTIHELWTAPVMVLSLLMFAFVFIQELGIRVGTIVLLIFTCLIDRYTFSVGRFDIRPEQVAALVGIGALLWTAARERRLDGHRDSWMPNREEMLLGAWFIVGLVSSYLAAASRSDSFKVLALVMISSAAFFLPRRLLHPRASDLDTVVYWLLLALALESAYALAVYFLHVFGPTLSMSVNRGQLSVFGTLWEPNVLGAMCAAGAIAWTYLGAMHVRRHWIGIALCASATIVTFTRAAWIALLVVLALTLVTPLRRRIDHRAVAVAAIAVVMMLGAILAAERVASYNPEQPHPLQTSTTIGTSVGDKGDIIGRIYQVRPVLDDLRNPILGAGIDSFGQRYVIGGVRQHIANVELMVLNDTGLLGLALLAAFAASIAVGVRRNGDNQVVLGLGATVAVVAITNQATESLELMVTWLLLGLLAAAISLSPQTASERSQRSRYRLVTASQE